MIPRHGPDFGAKASEKTETIRSLAQLQAYAQQSGADVHQLANVADEASSFAWRIPAQLLKQVSSWTDTDPVLRQVLPLKREREAIAGYSPDPVGESARQDGALLQKYAGRALLITTQACDVHCRYCFRREFDYAASHEPGNYDAAFVALAADPSIHELILSGGDPLTLSSRRMNALIAAADGVPHLKTLRIHTRSAVVNPARVTSELLKALAATRLRVVVVVHANCAQELSEQAEVALQKLRDIGAMLLNQAVLLAGVNDTVEAQIALSQRLLSCGVLTYYLHQLDRVSGAAHFEVPDDAARGMLAKLRAELPGYMVPKLVREQAGALSKTPI